MNGPAREAIDVKLEMDELWYQRIANMDKRWALYVKKRNRRQDPILASIDRRFRNLERDIRNLKKTVIIAGMGSTIATVFGVAVFNAAVLTNLVQNIESGRNVSAGQAEILRQQGEIDRHLIELERKALRINQRLEQETERRQDQPRTLTTGQLRIQFRSDE